MRACIIEAIWVALGLFERLVQFVRVVRELLGTLKREKLVLDWRKKQQAQAVYQHIYDS